MDERTGGFRDLGKEGGETSCTSTALMIHNDDDDDDDGQRVIDQKRRWMDGSDRSDGGFKVTTA